MKKDIFISITSENMKYLHELYRFTSNWYYPKEEKDFYKDDLGKIETETCVFRFIKHVNVIKEENNSFFLAKPDEKDMKEFDFQKEGFDKITNWYTSIV